MRRAWSRVIWGALLSASTVATLVGLGDACGAQASAATGTIAGHVYSADTNQPCRFATVSVRAAGGDGGSSASTTDLDGAFVVAGLSPGNYTVTAQMPGYIGTRGAGGEAQGDTTSGAAPTVRVEANAQTPVELRLEHGAALNGIVRYDDGSPAPGLSVRLYQRQSGGSWKAYANGGGAGGGFGATARTDDRGRYRIAGLPAGTYAVEASLPSGMSSVGRRNTLMLRSQPGQTLHVYSGNAFRVADATGVELHTGDERADADVQIPLAGLHTLRGVVEGRSTARSVGGGTVRLEDPNGKTVVRQTTIGEGGVFGFSFVPSGTYLVYIQAQGDRRGPPGAQFAPLEQTLVVDGDMVNLAYEVSDVTR